MVFNQQVMTCNKCGCTQKANPAIESGWYLAFIQGQKKNFCPQCFNGGIGAKKCPTCQQWFNFHYPNCPFCQISN